jgi:thiopeptide-type bacteriocin biosynthesis protein
MRRRSERSAAPVATPARAWSMIEPSDMNDVTRTVTHRPQHVARYVPAGFFVLRTPLLPLDLFERWADDGTGGAASRRAHEDRVRRRLRDHVNDARVQEALLLASPSLHQRLHYWLNDPLSAKSRKIEAALVKYFSRMCSRSTPFGLFAGMSTGRVGARTQLVLNDPSSYEKHARLDNGYVCRLAERLLGDDRIRRQLRFFPNDTICESGDRLRYVAYEVEARARTYRLAGVENSRAVVAALRMAQAGATLRALAQHVARSENVDEEEAHAFIDAMVDCRFLVSELEPTVTGDEPLRSMLATVAALDDKTDDVMRLIALDRKIGALNAGRVGGPAHGYDGIVAELDGLDAPRHVADALQVDLFKPAGDLCLDEGLVADIAQCAGLVYAATASQSRAVDGFIRRFVARYDDQRVPLGDVLDAEKGIGFGDMGADESHLLQDLKFAQDDAPESEAGTPFGRYLVRKFLEAVKNGSDEIAITRDDLARFQRDGLPPPPASICAKIVPVKRDEAGIAKAHVRFLSGSASSLFGRFCHGDETLRALTADLIAEEGRRCPHAVVAEIVHLPQGRIGNVVARPCFTDHEIVYLGRSGRPLDKQVRLDDLMLSVEDGRLRLWSNRLEREIVPRLSSAHHFLGKGNLGVYQFLASLQFAGAGRFGPVWPAWLQGMPYLPRISVGRLQLTHRQWNLSAADIDKLGDAYASGLPGKFAEVAGEYKLPRFVSLVEHDNALAIDFDNPLSTQVFFDVARGARSLRLEEAYVPAQDAAVSDGKHSYASEIFIPLLLSKDEAGRLQANGHGTPPSRAAGAVIDGHAVARTLAPGGECLYVKIYCGNATADRLIGGTLHDLLTGWTAKGQVEKWFFIRYADPEAHVRLRLFGPPAALWGGVVMDLNAALRPFLADRTIWKIQIDTYERELERYGGGDGILSCEKIFHADSEAAARFIPIGRQCGAEKHGDHAILGVDTLLKDFDIDASDRLIFLRRLAAGFGKEFNISKDQAILLGKKFRGMRDNLQVLLNGAPAGQSEARDIYMARSEIVRAEGRHLLQKLGRTRQQQICASVIHMSVNRFFRSEQRRHEMVIYDLLRRHYESLAGRDRAEN